MESTAAPTAAATPGAQAIKGSVAPAEGTSPTLLTGAVALADRNGAASTLNAGASDAKAATNSASSANGSATAPAAGGPAAGAAAISSANMSAAQNAVAAGFGSGTDPSSSSNDDSSTPAAAGAGGQDPAALGAAAMAAMSAVAGPLTSPASTAGAQATLALADITSTDKHSHGEAGDSSLSDTLGDGAAGAAQLAAGPGTGVDATATPTLKVSAEVGTPEFAQDVTDHLSWMVGNNLNGAKLEVNPAQLGPIEVRIAVQGNQAQVSLTAHSAATRDALEASSPKLREMLGAQGFAQVSVDISQRSFQERSPAAQSYDWQPPSDRSAPSAALTSASASTPRISNSVLDAYA
jgi:flagellar hook-length control protein FliK